MNIGIKSITNKGSITLEAVIFLPIFILAILTLGSFVRAIGVHENLNHGAMDETRRLMSKAYVVKLAPAFGEKVEGRVAEDNPKVQEIRVSKFGYLYKDMYSDGMISFQLNGSVNINMPLGFNQSYDMESRFKCRGFIGMTNHNAVVSFDEMEREGDSTIVWIFPMSGKRYHEKHCRYVQANPTQQVLTKVIRQQYEPCKLCKPEDMTSGVFVYCFFKAGGAYHKASCKTIDKYTVEVEKDEALKKGYSPCSKCQGG